MATVARLHRAPQYFKVKLVFQLLFLITLKGLSSDNYKDPYSSNKLYMGKDLSTPRVSGNLQGRRASIRRSTDSLTPRAKVLKTLTILHYCSVSALAILLSGDVCPNPGWTYTTLNRPGLKIGHLNIRSLPKHLDELKILLQDNPFDLLCLNETWLNSTWTDAELQIEGYNLIRTDRFNQQRGGGTAIYYTTKLTGHQRLDLNSSELEAVWLELQMPNKSKTLICSIYNSPSADLDIFKASLDKALECASSEGKSLIVIGDLNVDMKGERRSPQARCLDQLFNVYQLAQLVKDPTRITERSSTLIDLVYTSDKEKFVATGVLNCSISDHSLVYTIRRAKKARAGPKFIHYRNYKNYTPESFSENLHSPSWEEVNTSLTVNEAWQAFKKTLVGIMDKHAPMSTKRVRASTLPWLNTDIRALMKQRDHQHNKALKTKSPEHWASYKELRNKTTSLIRQCKRNYYSNTIYENRSDSSKLWKTLKSAISSKAKSSNIGCLETASGLTHEPKQIAQGFAQYFYSVVLRIRQNLPSLSPRPTPLSTLGNHRFKLNEIEEEFVLGELKKIKPNKSTGMENIPARLLKDGAEAITKPLTILMNRSLAEGSIPSEWKHAIVTPVHKSGDKKDAGNYRPISVLPVFSKILERAVHRMVYTYLQNNRLLSTFQSGFRPLHSTTTCLTDVTNTVLHNIDKGELTGMVFLDLTKAFDTLDHTLMLDKLSTLGFNQSSVQWFNAYLTDRTQSITADGAVSDPQPILFGIPQGSILGPLLFIIYINDLPSIIKHCNIQLYADDTLLYFSSSSIDKIESALAGDLESIINWLNKNYLFLNYTKTKVMLSGTRQRLGSVDSFTIKASDTILARVYQFKYLGVMLDPCLSWNDQIDHIAAKISSRLGMLRKARKIIPREACITLYNAMVLPLFDYCSVVWDSCGNMNRDYLDKLQRRAASIIEGHQVEFSNIRHTLNWPSLQSRRDYQKCILVYKCRNSLAPEYLLNEFTQSRDYHTYNTRHRDLLRLPLAKTAKYQSSFRFSGAKTWNMLPLNLRNESNYLKFKLGLKRHFSNLNSF